MRVYEIEKIAKSLGIADTETYPKQELIRKIQRCEGNFDCFGRVKDYCDQEDCLWRKDCLRGAKLRAGAQGG